MHVVHPESGALSPDLNEGHRSPYLSCSDAYEHGVIDVL